MFSSQHRLLLKRSHEDPIDVNGPCTHHLSALSTDEEQVLFEDLKVPSFLKNHRYFYGNSCGGIIWFNNSYDDEIVVWNPTTNEIKTLPPAHESEQKVCIDCCGLGYDSISEDYKFIRIISPSWFEADGRHFRGHTTRAELYSFNCNSWKEIPNLTIPIVKSWNSVYVDESYYWLAFFYNYNMIMSFDLANETFSTLPLPGSNYSYNRHLVDFEGSLGVLYFPDSIERTTTVSVELWVLNEKLESLWTKVFDVSLNGKFIKPFGFGENGRLLFCETMRDNQLLVYDRITQEIKEVDKYDMRFTHNIFSYVETTNPLPQANITTT